MTTQSQQGKGLLFYVTSTGCHCV